MIIACSYVNIIFLKNWQADGSARCPGCQSQLAKSQKVAQFFFWVNTGSRCQKLSESLTHKTRAYHCWTGSNVICPAFVIIIISGPETKHLPLHRLQLWQAWFWCGDLGLFLGQCVRSQDRIKVWREKMGRLHETVRSYYIHTVYFKTLNFYYSGLGFFCVLMRRFGIIFGTVCKELR